MTSSRPSIAANTSIPLADWRARQRASSASSALVGTRGVVMEERQARRVGGAGKIHRQLGGRVPPGQLGRVLLQRVLRVVDDQVRVGEELDVPLVLPMHAREPRPARRLGMVRECGS